MVLPEGSAAALTWVCVLPLHFLVVPWAGKPVLSSLKWDNSSRHTSYCYFKD